MIKTVFFGTPELAVPFLDALHEVSDFDLVAVVTQPDKPVGRKQVLTPSPVKLRAQELELPVLELKTLKHETPQGKLRDLGADLFVVFAYGKLIPKEVLEIAPAINVHPSLLPKYRGPSPLQTAILNQDTETGISIMLLDELMDHGPILAQDKFTLDPNETIEGLTSKVIERGPKLLIDAARGYLDKTIEPVAQDDSKAIECQMITREDGKINWNDPADKIGAQIRALGAWPGVYTETDDLRIKILGASIAANQNDLAPGQIAYIDDKMLVGTSTNPIEIFKLQPAGKKPVDVKTFKNGHSKILEFN